MITWWRSGSEAQIVPDCVFALLPSNVPACSLEVTEPLNPHVCLFSSKNVPQWEQWQVSLLIYSTLTTHRERASYWGHKEAVFDRKNPVRQWIWLVGEIKQFFRGFKANTWKWTWNCLKQIQCLKCIGSVSIEMHQHADVRLFPVHVWWNFLISKY